MKRMNFVLMIALAITAAPAALAQQAQGGQGRTGQPLCRDAKGAPYSQGALIRDAEGDVVGCESGKWEPAPLAATGAQTAGGSGQGRGPQTVVSVQGTGISMTNVRLELTITDQTGTGAPIKKVMTLLLAERGEGRVRSAGHVYQAATAGHPDSGFKPVTLNADAVVVAAVEDRVRVRITVEYAPATPAAGEAPRATPLNQSVEVALTNGKPTIIVQSSDPVADRKVTLEATATIVR